MSWIRHETSNSYSGSEFSTSISTIYDDGIWDQPKRIWMEMDVEKYRWGHG